MLKKLNDSQKREINKFLYDYKFVYICNDCGNVYGTDLPERKIRICPNCEVTRLRKKKEEKNG